MHIFFSFFFCLFIFPIFANSIQQVVILGSGPAGLTAAIYTTRAGLSTLVIEGEEPGGQITLSYAVDNFPGFPQGIGGVELGMQMREQAQRFGAVIKNGMVTKVDFSQHPFVLTLEDGKTLFTETLIIASGASAKWLGLDSEKALIGKGVSSCAVCDGFFFKNKEVVVVGGGDTALEDALFLANYASRVTIVHRRELLKASPYLQKKAFAEPKIHFIWNSVLEDIHDSDQGQVTGVMLKNLNNQETCFYRCDGVFIAIGHIPNTALFGGKIELDQQGYIKTLPFTTQTSIPGVFAAGDVADPHYRQAITAAGMGCMAGIDAYHFIQQMDSYQEEP